MGDTGVVFKSGQGKIEIQPGKTSIDVRISGVLNEETHFDRLLGMLAHVEPSTEMRIDLGGITRINSQGLREWLLFLAGIPTSVRLRFTLVNELVVKQAGMVSNFLGKPGNRVDALEVPFFCDSCKTRMVRVMKPSELRNESGQLGVPKIPCPKCRRPQSLDALESEYLVFLED
jgi:hypothetical protein